MVDCGTSHEHTNSSKTVSEYSSDEHSKDRDTATVNNFEGEVNTMPQYDLYGALSPLTEFGSDSDAGELSEVDLLLVARRILVFNCPSV